MGQEEQDFKKNVDCMKKRKNMPFKTEIPIHFSCVYLHMCSLNIRCPKLKKNKTKQKQKTTQNKKKNQNL